MNHEELAAKKLELDSIEQRVRRDPRAHVTMPPATLLNILELARRALVREECAQLIEVVEGLKLKPRALPSDCPLPPKQVSPPDVQAACDEWFERTKMPDLTHNRAYWMRGFEAGRPLDKPAWPNIHVAQEAMIVAHAKRGPKLDVDSPEEIYAQAWEDAYDYLTQHAAPAKEKE